MPVPLNFFWVSVTEKMACERDDCAFMSVSFVRRCASTSSENTNAYMNYVIKAIGKHLRHDIGGAPHRDLAHRIVPSFSSRICTTNFIHGEKVDEVFIGKVPKLQI